MSIQVELEKKYLSLFLALEKENENAALKQLQAILMFIQSKKQLTPQVLDVIWTSVERIFLICLPMFKDQRDRACGILKEYKAWQEQNVPLLSTPVLSIKEALDQLALLKCDQAITFAHYLRSESTFFSLDSESQRQQMITRLIVGKKQITALRYAVCLVQQTPTASGTVGLGQVALSFGAEEQALKLFHQALSYDPQSVDALWSLALVLAKKQPKDAFSYYQQALLILTQPQKAQVMMSPPSTLFATTLDFLERQAAGEVIMAPESEASLLVMIQSLRKHHQDPLLLSQVHDICGLIYGYWGHAYDAMCQFTLSARLDTQGHVQRMMEMERAFSHTPQTQHRLYQYALHGLHDELRKRPGFTADDAWAIMTSMRARGEALQERIARDIAFIMSRNTHQWPIDDKPHLINAYLQWIFQTFLKHQDYFSAIQYWLRLIDSEPVQSLRLEPLFLEELEKAYASRSVAWPKELETIRQKTLRDEMMSTSLQDASEKRANVSELMPQPPMEAAVVVEIADHQPAVLAMEETVNESCHDRLLRQMSDWIAQIKQAQKEKKTPGKSTVVVATDLLGLEQQIQALFQAFSRNKKHYPPALLPMEALLNSLQSPACEPYYYELARLYTDDPLKTRRLYQEIIKRNPLTIEAYLALAESAYAANQWVKSKEWLESITGDVGLFESKIQLILQKITQKQAEWTDKLNKFKAITEQSSPVLSSIKQSIQACDVFMRDKEGSDLYADFLLERTILNLLRHKHQPTDLTCFPAQQKSILDEKRYFTELSDLVRVVSLKPDLFKAHLWLGHVHQLMAKLYFEALRNEWIVDQLNTDVRSQIEKAVFFYFTSAKENFLDAIRFSTPDPLHAVWKLAQLLDDFSTNKEEVLKQYHVIARSDSPQAAYARVKMADVYYRMGQHALALETYRLIEADEHFDVRWCTQSKLYFTMAMLAFKLRHFQGALLYCESAQRHIETSPCFDLPGLNILIANVNKKVTIATLSLDLMRNPELSKRAVLLRRENQYYFHDVVNGVLQEESTALGDINFILSEEGISIGTLGALNITNHHNANLFRAIQAKKGWEHPVVSWQTSTLEGIQKLRRSIEKKIPQQSLAVAVYETESVVAVKTTDNPYRFSCAALSSAHVDTSMSALATTQPAPSSAVL